MTAYQGSAWGWGPLFLLIHPVKACFWHSRPSASTYLTGKASFCWELQAISAPNPEVWRGYTLPWLIFCCSRQGGEGGGTRGRPISLLAEETSQLIAQLSTGCTFALFHLLQFYVVVLI